MTLPGVVFCWKAALAELPAHGARPRRPRTHRATRWPCKMDVSDFQPLHRAPGMLLSTPSSVTLVHAQGAQKGLSGQTADCHLLAYEPLRKISSERGVTMNVHTGTAIALQAERGLIYNTKGLKSKPRDKHPCLVWAHVGFSQWFHTSFTRTQVLWGWSCPCSRGWCKV